MHVRNGFVISGACVLNSVSGDWLCYGWPDDDIPVPDIATPAKRLPWCSSALPRVRRDTLVRGKNQAESD
jgi:hypothetical protein